MLRCARTGRKCSDFWIWATAKSLNGRAKADSNSDRSTVFGVALTEPAGSHLIAADSRISVWRKIQQLRQLII